MPRRRRTLAELRQQREWTLPEFAQILGRSWDYVDDRRVPDRPDDPTSDGHIRLPVGDVPYITDRFAATVRPRRLVLAVDYETVEQQRRLALEQGAGFGPHYIAGERVE